MIEQEQPESMRVRGLTREDRPKLLCLLAKTGVFTAHEIDVAMELIDIVLQNPQQDDYEIYCLVDDRDQPLGYICYGPAPMTQGTFDLYWIAVDPESQQKGIGSMLVDFLEGAVKERNGRMILVDTSSTLAYEAAHRFYLQKGFREAGRILDYYGPGNDRVTFCKRLD